MSPSAHTPQGRPVHVTAVVVSHNGRAWIPRLLQSLERSTRLPDQLVAVDTGSIDDSAELRADALGVSTLVRTRGRISFGSAVQLGLDHAAAQRAADIADHEQWVWILHDDLAVEPEALAELLAETQSSSGVDVVGPKVREWPARKRLLEVGLTATGTGRRDTGVEWGEYDQGQHDRSREVLAVGSAGMLVRRTVWDRLDGFDPALPYFADDLDFGWRAASAGFQTRVCPDAVIYHAAAASRGRRSVDAVRGSAGLLARKHTLLTVLAGCRGWAVPLMAVRLLFGSLLRALGLLLIRAPREAMDEVLAIAAVLLQPHRLWAMRRRRRRSAKDGGAAARALLAPWWAPYRRGLDTAGQVVAEAFDALADRRPTMRREVETGPVAEESENLEADTGPIGWLLGRPMAAVVAVLMLLSLLAPGVDLLGSGVLRGGALLPAPPAVLDWWRLYVESWHPVATGSDVPAPPYVLLLAALGTVLVGQEWLAVDVLIGGAVPLAALTAYVAGAGVIASRPIRMWAAVAYGLLPVLSGAVAQGRIGTVVAVVLAPLAVWLVRRAVTVGSSDRSMRAGLTAGLVVSAVVAFAPAAWLLALVVVIGLVAFVVVRGTADARTVAGLTAVVVLPFVLLLPWTLHLSMDPVRWLSDVGYGAGVPRLADPTGWMLALGRPGGPGDAPAWLGIGVAAAAVAALFRTDRRGGVLAAWGVAFAAVLVVVVQRTGGAWPGFTVVMLQGAAVAAAAIAADGALDRLGSASFGWKQPLAVVVAAAAVLSPLLGLGWWLAADQTLVERTEPVAVPAFMADAQLGPTKPRTLVLSTTGAGVDYHLSRESGMRLGQEAVLEEAPGLRAAVGRLVTDPTSDDVTDLAMQGVAYVVLAQPDQDVTASIDGAPGMQRASAGESGAAAWRVNLPAAGALLVSGGDMQRAAALPSSRGDLDTAVDDSDGERELLLSERADEGWRAWLDGEELAVADATEAGTQSFVVPSGGGQLQTEHDNGRGWWLALQLVVLGLAIVLAAPSQRRGYDAEEDR